MANDPKNNLHQVCTESKKNTVIVTVTDEKDFFNPTMRGGC